MTLRIVVTGATGTLGRQLLPVLAGLGECIGLGRRDAPEGGYQLDLTDAANTDKLLDQIQPDVIVHAAALADVDLCERDPVIAYRANVVATRNLVDWGERQKPTLRMIYVSTDQVYDLPGESDEDEVAPINVYALTKLWAEDVASRLDNHLVLRTNFFSLGNGGRTTSVDWIVSSCQTGRPITLFRDVLFNPLHVDHLAELVAELLPQNARGIVNLGASGGGLSKGDFIRSVAERFDLSTAGMKEGSIADVKLEARRPCDTRMGTSKAERLLGHAAPTLEAGLERLENDWRSRAGDVGAGGQDALPGAAPTRESHA